jgi:hypothetical protein
MEVQGEVPKPDNKEEGAETEQGVETANEKAGEAGPSEEAVVPEKPEEPKEQEQDAPSDSRTKIASAVVLNETDSTVNVLRVENGPFVTSLRDGGLQYLLAGTRASVGVKAGRYMFEVKIVESYSSSEPQNPRNRNLQSLVRVGLSLSKSSLFQSGDESISFDSDGYFTSGAQRKKITPAFARGITVALLLNLDESTNAKTVSLFHDGVRVSEPQPIPENLVGKALFPTLTFRGVTLQVNFGPSPLAPLPFTCTTVGAAAQDDVEVVPTPAEGKNEVVFPIALPEKGVFDWADHFLQKNPAFTELSDRKIIEWAAASGIKRTRPPVSAHASMDKPELSLGIPPLDDLSASRVLSLVTPALRRNFLVMEVQANLSAAGRKEALERFSAPHFHKRAVVLMGEPDAGHKERVRSLLLSDKKAKAAAEKKKLEVEAMRKKLLEERRKKAEEAKNARLAAQNKDEERTEEVKDTQMEGVVSEEKKENDAAAEEDKVVELTEEERNMWARKSETPDMSQSALAKSFTSFSLPSSGEGFDSVVYEWQPEEACAAEVLQFVKKLKLTTRVEDLEPSQWFKEESHKRQKLVAECQKLQAEWKDPTKRTALLEKRKAAKAGEKKVENEGDEEAPAEEPQGEDSMQVDPDDVEALTVEDINDIGTGEPLFANFAFEDWSLLRVRLELHLLLVSFKRDLNDPERQSFHESHLSFYYYKYFKKSFNIKFFGVDKFAGLAALIGDTVVLKDEGMISCELADDTEHVHFVRLAEEHRRDRQRRLDAGDETAALKFSKPAPPPTRNAQQSWNQKRPYEGGQQSSHQQKRPVHGGGYPSGGGYYGSVGRDASRYNGGYRR